MSSSPPSRRRLISGSMSNVDLAAVERDDLALQVDRRLAGLHQRLDVVLRQDHRQQPDLRAVRIEDVRERRRDDRLEAVVLERPRRVLARRAAAEVAPGGEDRVGGQVPAGLLLPVVEEELAEAGPLDPLQELLGDDLVGVHVGAVEHRHGPADDADGLHQLQLLMSTKWPSTAAAAAICGLTRWVRPPLPWRPSKLRFEVEAQRSPGLRGCPGSSPGTSSSRPSASRSRRRGRPRRAPPPRPAPSPAASRARPSRARPGGPCGRRASRRRRAGRRSASSCTSPRRRGRAGCPRSACRARGPCT